MLKKILASLLTVTAISTLAIAPVSADADPSRAVTADYAYEKPVIDGKGDDAIWQSTVEFSTDDGQEHILTDEGLGQVGKFRVLWDETDVYVLITLENENSINNTSEKGDDYNNNRDRIALYFDFLEENFDSYESGGTGDFGTMHSLYQNEADKNYDWNEDDSSNATFRVRLVESEIAHELFNAIDWAASYVTASPSSWTFEVKIPYKVRNSAINLTEGYSFGFDATWQDAPDGHDGRTFYATWSGTDDGWTTPSSLPSLKLVKTARAEAATEAPTEADTDAPVDPVTPTAPKTADASTALFALFAIAAAAVTVKIKASANK
ncbi:endo-1,4-beta-xylanase [Clostridia bacterium]|nr:endo-1,4-beta-xylanase [Clostridia bacterium]